MKLEFIEVFEAFKKLDENEKKKKIIDFLKNDIIALQKLNTDIGNNLGSKNINKINNSLIEDDFDAIYELLHILTEQIEIFSEKISQEFYE